MKKLFVLIAMTALLFSCEKESVTSSMNYIEVDTTLQDSIELTQDTIIYDTSIFILNMGYDTIIMVEPRGTNFDTVTFITNCYMTSRNDYSITWKMIVVDMWEKIDDGDTIISASMINCIDDINLLNNFTIICYYIDKDGKYNPINFYYDEKCNAIPINKYDYSITNKYYNYDKEKYYYLN